MLVRKWFNLYKHTSNNDRRIQEGNNEGTQIDRPRNNEILPWCTSQTKHRKNIFIAKEVYKKSTKEIRHKPLPLPIELNEKLSKNDAKPKVDGAMYQNLFGSLIYLPHKTKYHVLVIHEWAKEGSFTSNKKNSQINQG